MTLYRTLHSFEEKGLVHSINDDRCTGCDACVAVCPTNVLDLVDNKSRVLRFEDCIQCEACMWACPTTALVMHLEGTEPPPLKIIRLPAEEGDLLPSAEGSEEGSTIEPGAFVGGAAMSVREVTGRPILYASVGESFSESGALAKNATLVPSGEMATLPATAVGRSASAGRSSRL